MYALKYSHLIKEKVGHDTKVYDFYIDMRCFGEGYEEFYRRCQEEGTTFIRGKVAEISDQAMTPEERRQTGGHRRRHPAGQTPAGARGHGGALHGHGGPQRCPGRGRIFGVNQGADGFFLEEHPKLGR
jgi:heterodisulfide reductase subunit A